jgi:hypothetical protein
MAAHKFVFFIFSSFFCHCNGDKTGILHLERAKSVKIRAKDRYSSVTEKEPALLALPAPGIFWQNVAGFGKNVAGFICPTAWDNVKMVGIRINIQYGA